MSAQPWQCRTPRWRRSVLHGGRVSRGSGARGEEHERARGPQWSARSSCMSRPHLPHRRDADEMMDIDNRGRRAPRLCIVVCVSACVPHAAAISVTRVSRSARLALHLNAPHIHPDLKVFILDIHDNSLQVPRVPRVPLPSPEAQTPDTARGVRAVEVVRGSSGCSGRRHPGADKAGLGRSWLRGRGGVSGGSGARPGGARARVRHPRNAAFFPVECVRGSGGGVVLDCSALDAARGFARHVAEAREGYRYAGGYVEDGFWFRYASAGGGAGYMAGVAAGMPVRAPPWTCTLRAGARAREKPVVERAGG
ncbi:hypothetical protein B0H14DRAFT_1278815 [Mycena olivaceomarginata]|nr:hypothetical protein B0H14DRAFT_1278815 [Mycena olivaceomarginata]